MRYGKTGYYWVNDNSPKMIMHPIKPALNGKNLSKVKDPSNVYLFNEMVKVTNQKGAGFVEYAWDKGNNNIQPKLSYVKEFKPWGWIIGTGAYVDDIEAEVKFMKQETQEAINAIILELLVTMIIVTIIIIVVFSMITNKFIINPLKNLETGLLQFFKFVNKEVKTVEPLVFVSEDEIGNMSSLINDNIIQSKHFVDQEDKFIREVKDIVEQINQGNLNQTIVQSTNNENLNELKTLFNHMLQNLSSNISNDINKLSIALERYQKLDFTHRIPDCTGETEKGLNNLALIINDMLVENKKNGLLIDESSDILIRNVNILSDNSNEVASALHQTVSALDSMTSNISKNTTNISKMSNYAKQLQSSSSDGKTLASQTTTAMDEINDEVHAINEAITVIDQITFQTNILSLNAAVEAATAGEAGKGFAVVAGEVRNLAARSAEAANEIKKLVENASNKAQTGKDIADKMIIGYNELNENINNTFTLIQTIETISKDQLHGIDQVNDAVQALDKKTNQNAQIATQTNTVALQTDQLSKVILNKVT